MIGVHLPAKLRDRLFNETRSSYFQLSTHDYRLQLTALRSHHHMDGAQILPMPGTEPHLRERVL